MVGYGPISIPNPNDYNMADPEQCNQFYQDLNDELDEFASIVGGALGGAVDGPAGGAIAAMAEEFLKDFIEENIDRNAQQDCRDDNQNGLTDPYENDIIQLEDIPIPVEGPSNGSETEGTNSNDGIQLDPIDISPEPTEDFLRADEGSDGGSQGDSSDTGEDGEPEGDSSDTGEDGEPEGDSSDTGGDREPEGDSSDIGGDREPEGDSSDIGRGEPDNDVIRLDDIEIPYNDSGFAGEDAPVCSEFNIPDDDCLIDGSNFDDVTR